MKISTRLLTGFLSVLLLLVIIAAIGTWRMQQVDHAVGDMVDNVMQKERLFSTWASNTAVNGARTIAVAESNDAARQEQIKAKIKETSAEISAIQKKLEGFDKNAEETALMNQIGDKRKVYTAARDEVFKEKAGNPENAQKLMHDKLEPALDDYVASIRKLSDYQTSAIEQAAGTAKNQIKSTSVLLPVLGIISVLIGLGVAIGITRSIKRQLGGEPSYTVGVMRDIANGDLTLQIDTAGATHDSLIQAVKAMRDSLANIVGEVRNGTEAIATASNEIASGNMDLSSRTEHQASSLEETASSMEQLTSTVKQNAEHALEANRLAGEASRLAVEGGTVVAQVVDTMSSIDESSKRIVDIIGVIDSIAFQTNILALNAAVEAARAGEQGRGFAVVAAEVRNLAQRSAGAAREIKSLIDDSVSRVATGSQLVNRAGGTMEQVVESVRRVDDIIANIANASREQTSGIEQVNIAIRGMDDVTQQNAALVEQAAAAAQSMQDQASNLRQVVGVFKLKQVPIQTAAPATARLSAKPTISAARTLAVVATKPSRVAQKTSDDWEEF